MAEETKDSLSDPLGGVDRRDFVLLGAGACAAVFAGAAAVPMIRSMAPSADVESQRTVEVDISKIKEGEFLLAEWQGKPVFVVHRDKKQIEAAKGYDGKSKDPKTKPDADRATKPEWLVVVGVCTHLGCTPLWRNGEDADAPWKAWHCPCHGSQYDFSGRIIAGPAPQDLLVPDYEFLEGDKTLKIGKEA